MGWMNISSKLSLSTGAISMSVKLWIPFVRPSGKLASINCWNKSEHIAIVSSISCPGTESPKTMSFSSLSISAESVVQVKVSFSGSKNVYGGVGGA